MNLDAMTEEELKKMIDKTRDISKPFKLNKSEEEKINNLLKDK